MILSHLRASENLIMIPGFRYERASTHALKLRHLIRSIQSSTYPQGLSHFLYVFNSEYVLFLYTVVQCLWDSQPPASVRNSSSRKDRKDLLRSRLIYERDQEPSINVYAPLVFFELLLPVNPLYMTSPVHS